MSTVLLALQNNKILARLPIEERDVILAYLETVNLANRQIIEQAGSEMVYLHFPINSAISMTDTRLEGEAVEVTVTGKEGCSGSFFILGTDRALCTTLVQVGGSALRLPISTLIANRHRLPRLSAVLARYCALLTRHAVISVGCNRFHSVEQRIARWLLAHWNRTGLQTFPFSPEFMAAQAGELPETVKQALTQLETSGVLTSSLGRIEILDRQAVEQRSCECFALAMEAMDSYLAYLQSFAAKENF